MNPSQHMDREHSQLFLVRLWAELGNSGSGGEGRGGKVVWCGKLQNVVSGQAEYFHDWPRLIDLLLEMSGTDTLDSGDFAPPD
jgi:hypothetical protein